MKEYFEVLRQSPLFAGVSEEIMPHVLRCMEAHTTVYGKGAIICHYGDRTLYSGIVLEGKAALLLPGEDGEESCIRMVGPAEAFGCSRSCSCGAPSTVSIIARTRTTILFLKLSKLFCREALGCQYAGLVMANVLKETAAENLSQEQRIHIMSQKSIRGKLKMLLSQSVLCGNKAVLSMNRQELADYLGVERSALSREMRRMKDDGLIDYCRNEITIFYKIA